MTSHFAINCGDRLLRYVRDDSRPFGGTCVLLGGDVKQLLPVASDRVCQMELLFTKCDAWSHFNTYELTNNVRAQSDTLFADWLEQLGTGRLNTPLTNAIASLPTDTLRIPPHCLTTDVVDAVYDGIFTNDSGECSAATVSQLSQRAILCPKNEHCKKINDQLIQRMPGESVTFLSIDSIDTHDDDERLNFPEDLLNNITPNGMPPHKLTLKVGMPVILLRNLSLKDGLINGARLVVLEVTHFVMKAQIATRKFTGRLVLIPRMDLTSNDPTYPFILKRRQFPVQVCFALTINRAQGQTFQNVGIYLESPVFAHGQLYVAFSRAKNWQSVKVQIHHTDEQRPIVRNSDTIYTKNIVYQNVFQHIPSRQIHP